MIRTYDVAIVGGGLVGATLAAALRRSPLSVTLIDPGPRGAGGGGEAIPKAARGDGRSLALSPGSAGFYERLGLWAEVRHETSPITEVHVSCRGRLGVTRLRAAECGVETLGYVVAARGLERALEAALAEREEGSRIRAAVEGVEPRGRGVLVEARAPDGKPVTVAARLVVGADGVHSVVRRGAGLPLRVHRCDQVAIAGDLVPERPHRGRAFERFTRKGPLALLPCGEDRCAFIWALPAPEAEAADGPNLGAHLAEAFGSRLGRLHRIEARVRQRLQVCHAPQVADGRTVLVGNAANALHPVGAQGFNLGLRDVEALIGVLDDAAAAGADPASGLARYRAARRADHRMARLLTEGLLRVFGSRPPSLPGLGAAGLFMLDRLGPVKRGFVLAAMGGGRMRRTARFVGEAGAHAR